MAAHAKATGGSLPISVSAYGGVANDASFDNAPAFAAAIAAAGRGNTLGGCVVVPSGRWYISSPILPTNSVMIRGEAGGQGSVIQAKADWAGTALLQLGPYEYGFARDLYLDGANLATYCLYAHGIFANSDVSGIVATRGVSACIKINGNPTSFGQIGFDRIWAINPQAGPCIDIGPGAAIWARDWTVEGPPAGQPAIKVLGPGHAFMLDGAHLEGPSTNVGDASAGIDLDGIEEFAIRNIDVGFPGNPSVFTDLIKIGNSTGTTWGYVDGLWTSVSLDTTRSLINDTINSVKKMGITLGRYDVGGGTRPETALRANGILGTTIEEGAVTTNAAPATQQIYLARVAMKRGDVVNNIHVVVHQAGAGATPTTVKLGFYSKDGVRRAVTANITADAKWTTTGRKSFPVATPYVIPADDLYYIAYLQDGVFATPMQMLRGGAVTTMSLGTITYPPFAGGGAGKTDLTTPLTIDAAVAASWFLGWS